MAQRSESRASLLGYTEQASHLKAQLYNGRKALSFTFEFVPICFHANYSLELPKLNYHRLDKILLSL